MKERKKNRKEHVLHRRWHAGRGLLRPLIHHNDLRRHIQAWWRHLGQHNSEEHHLLFLDLRITRTRQIDRLLENLKENAYRFEI